MNNQYLPKPTSVVSEWEEKYQKLEMKNGEDPTTGLFCRVQMKSQAYWSHAVMLRRRPLSTENMCSPSYDYDHLLEKRTILADDDSSRKRIEKVVRKTNTGFLKRPTKTVGKALVAGGIASAMLDVARRTAIVVVVMAVVKVVVTTAAGAKLLAAIRATAPAPTIATAVSQSRRLVRRI